MADTVKVVNGGLDAATKALDLYNSTLDTVIPWKTFEDTMKKLASYEKDYSQKAAKLVGESKTLLLNSEDEYLKATREVFEWASVTARILLYFIKGFDKNDEKTRELQKKVILKVLTDGETKMEASITALEASSKSFNGAFGKLSELTTILNDELQQGSSYFHGQVDKIRRDAYAGAAAGVVGGPFGLAISYSIAAGIVEGKLIPELLDRFEEVKASFKTMLDTVETAKTAITGAKASLRQEVNIISEMKTQTDTTKFEIELGDLAVMEMKESAQKLIDMCNAYKARHSSKSF